MKKKIKILSIVVLTILFIIICKNNVKAASATLSVSKTSITLGETVTITTTINGASWDVALSGAITQRYADTTDDAENATKVYTYSFTPTSVGSYTIKLSGNISDSTASVSTPVSESEQKTINVIQSSRENPESETGTATTTEKSSNANLSNLGIRPNDFTGFRPATTTYNVTVPEDVESVEVYATAADSKARVSGTGTKTLQKGANALNVTVTAEDGTTKTYTINVTREGEEEQTEENTEEPAEVKNGLSSIKIANLELNPSFSTDVYEYTVKYIGEDTSLDIQAVATDPSYTVEILGNEELKEGDNTITILVTDAEGNNVATYQVTVNKSLVDEEALAKEEEEKQKEEQRKILLIAGGVAIIILIIVIVIIIKRRRNRAYAEEFSGVPFAGMNEEEDYYNDYDYTNEDYDDYYDNDNNFNDYNDQEIQGNNNSLLEENNDDSQIQEETKKVNSADTEDNNEQELDEKERAKREFLNGYNSDDEDYFEDEKTRRGRKRGKRFK